MAYSRIIGTAVVALFALTNLASAQTIAPNHPATSIEVVSGVMDYDFQGVGQVMPFAIRATRSITGGLSFEVGTTFARPAESFGRSTFAAPEARLVYAWQLGRVSPFVAGGGGVSAMSRPLVGTQWRPTLLGGGGARINLSDRIYALGEMRIRTVGSNFSASTAEWLGGIGWRFL